MSLQNQKIKPFSKWSSGKNLELRGLFFYDLKFESCDCQY